MIKVKAVKCIHCGDIIYSRAHYDMRYCSCHKTFVDGGAHIIDNPKRGYMRSTLDSINTEIELEFDSIGHCKKALYDDWNYSTDNYGVIKNGNT